MIGDRRIAGENIHVLPLYLHSAVFGDEATVQRDSARLARYAVELEDVEGSAQGE